MIHSKSKAFRFFLLFAIFSNCRDDYNFKSIESVSHLVVDGGINSGPGPYLIKLGITNISSKPTLPVDGALITIRDNRGQEEIFAPDGNGRYLLNGSTVKGTLGTSYTLEIKLPDGKMYHSTPEVMPTAPLAKDTIFFAMEKVDVVSSEGVTVKNYQCNVFLTTRLQESHATGYFRWGVEEVYLIIPFLPSHSCWVYVPTSRSKLILVKSTDFANAQLANVLLQNQAVDYSFGYAHMFSVTQYAMNKANYDYWIKARDLTERKGSVFDTPPAPLPGNVTSDSDPDEIVYGYFEATAQQIKRMRVSRGHIPTDALVNCDMYPFLNFCGSCDELTGSTRKEPDWWFD